MIEPGGIPQYTGDFGQLEKAASSLRTHAIGIRNGGKDVHSRFQAMAAYYQAPEADKLFSSTRPVMDTAEEFAGNIEALADALDTFVFEARPHAERLKQLKLDAFTFVDSVRGDDDWTEDQGKNDKHQALMDGVAAAREGFQEAERNAANKINAISPALCRPKWVVDDGTHGPGMYGQSADTLKGMKDLPWGSPEERTYERWSLEWWGHGAKSWAWDGIVKDSIVGGLDGLATLAGFHGEQERDQAWDGLRRTVVGGYAYGMDLLGQDEHLSDWQRESKAYAKEFGKQFIAYDMWQEDPARAHAVTSFNVLTLGAGPLAAASKLGKGGTLAKAAGTMARVGDALDPLGGAFKATKALSDLPKVSQVLANISNHLHLPTTKFPDGALDLSDRYRVDKHGNLIPLNPDGTPHLEPAKHEPSAAERGVGGRQGNRELVTAGRHAPEATARAGDLSTSPSANHGPSTGADHRTGSSSGGHEGAVNGSHSEGASGSGHNSPGGGGHDGPTGFDHGRPNGGGSSGDNTAAHRAEFEAARETPPSQRTAAERAAITREHVRLANEDPVWRAEHYDKWGSGYRNDAKELVDGQLLPKLIEKPDGSWMAASELPYASPEQFHLTPLERGRKTVAAADLNHLDDVAAKRTAGMELTKAQNAFDDAPTAENTEALAKAQEHFDKTVGVDVPNNSKLGEALGEEAARRHMLQQKEFEGAHEVTDPPLPETPNGSKRFDQLWRDKDGNLVIVEAKGPQATLEWRQSNGDPKNKMMVKQGTIEYVRTILADMNERAPHSPGDAKYAREIRKAIKSGTLRYVLVQAAENTGQYAGATLKYFKIF